MQQVPAPGPAFWDVFKADPSFFVVLLVVSQAGLLLAIVSFRRRKAWGTVLSVLALLSAIACVGGGIAARSNRISTTEAVSANLPSADRERLSVVAHDEGNYMLKAGALLATIPLFFGSIAMLVARRKKG